MIQRHSLVTLAVWISLLLGAVPAWAAGAFGNSAAHTVQTGDVVLQYRASDLASSEGRARTYARLQSAAAQVCARYADRELVRQLVHHRCLDRVLSAAVLEIQDAGLQALHNARHGGRASGSDVLPIRTARR